MYLSGRCRSRHIVGVFALLLTIVAIARVWAQSPNSPSVEDELPPRVRFTEVLERFAAQKRINVLADYITGEQAPTVKRKLAPDQLPTLENILEAYRRQAVQVGSTLVISSFIRDAYHEFNEKRAEKIFGPLFWRDARVEVKVKRDDNGVMRVTARVSEASVKTFCEQFATHTGWEIQVDPEVENTRIFARWDMASPGEIVEALSVLLQTKVEAKLLLSEQQKKGRQRAFSQMLQQDSMAQRWVRSDEILNDLLSVLTPEEMERYRRGELVEVHLSRLPQDIYERALQYVSFAIGVLIDDLGARDEFIMTARDRLREAEIVLFLPSIHEGRFGSGIGIGLKHPEKGNWGYF